MQVTEKSVVSIAYVVQDSQGVAVEVFDANEPFEFLFGEESLLPGLENLLRGKHTGDKLEMELPLGDAVDELHPWAGQNLHVSITVLHVRNASPFELFNKHAIRTTEYCGSDCACHEKGIN